MEFEFGVWNLLSSGRSDVLQLVLSHLLKVLIRWRHKRQRSIIHPRNKWVTQRLQRCHSLPWVNLQYLLYKVNKLKDLSSFIDTIFKRCFGTELLVLFEKLFLKFKDVPLLKQLAEVEEGVISLRDFNGVVELSWHTCHHKFLKCFEVIPLLIWVELEESVSIYGVVNHVIGWETTKLHDFKHLIIVIFPWKDGCFNKQFNGSAA